MPPGEPTGSPIILAHAAVMAYMTQPGQEILDPATYLQASLKKVPIAFMKVEVNREQDNCTAGE